MKSIILGSYLIIHIEGERRTEIESSLNHFVRMMIVLKLSLPLKLKMDAFYYGIQWIYKLSGNGIIRVTQGT